tara:strand:+ start:326 stop:445 length:120 start_codon:yes stop_codon:yes gene_type:complete
MPGKKMMKGMNKKKGIHKKSSTLTVLAKKGKGMYKKGKK